MAVDRNSVMDPKVAAESVQNTPKVDGAYPERFPGVESFAIFLNSAADELPRWGTEVIRRDKGLRNFWKQESILASAVFGVAAANTGLSWTLDGPMETAVATQELLLGANFGQGWQHFMMQLNIDLLTQDNGAFIEVIRAENDPSAPVRGISHLDSSRCIRTGDPETPVVYWDRKDVPHKMAWYQIIPIVEMPSPVESMNGMQVCAVSRVLRAAQILRSISVYKDEKLSGRNPRSIHIVGGVRSDSITDAIRQAKENADNMGQVRYMNPVIMGSLDPREPVSTVEIELAGLPDNFDADVELKWYIAQLALGFGRDYQDFAPLPGGNLGTASQGEILARKSRGKGPGLFTKIVEHALNWGGVIPHNVVFRYDEPDAEAARAMEEVRRIRFGYINNAVKDGTLTPEVAHAYLERHGDLSPDELVLLGDTDITPDIHVGERPEIGTRALPEVRDLSPEYAALTGKYQRELEGISEDWIRDTSKAIDQMTEPQARAEMELRLGTLQETLIAKGREDLPKAFAAGNGMMAMTGDDQAEVALAIEQNSQFIRSSFIPFVRQTGHRAIFGE